MAGRFVLPTVQAFDTNGDPGAGDKLYFYQSGTSTPLDTYSDDDLATANTNPVVADSAGRFGDIFLQAVAYKVIWTTSAGSVVGTYDPVRSTVPPSQAVITKTTTYTIGVADAGKLIQADATAGAFTLSLPPAATAGDGWQIPIKKVDSSSNAVTVDADGSETIDGGTDVTLPNQWDTLIVRSNGSAWRIIVQPSNEASTPLGYGFMGGLTLSNNSTDAEHDIDISEGACRDDANTANLSLSSTLVKRLDASWAVGTANGGLDTGAVAADTWYYVWLIRRSDTGVVDALFSASDSAPTMPTSYDQKRLIGAVLTDGSANIISDQFIQVLASGEKQFTSAEQTMAADTKLDVPHGLAAIPKRTQIIARCETNDGNFSAGDEFDGYGFSVTSAADPGVITMLSDTNVSIVGGSAFRVVDPSTFNSTALTPASWRWIVRAWY